MELFPYQREGVAWLAGQDRALLADTMGLGKTVQALMAVPPSSPVLVVCPAAVKGVWTQEASRWRPEMRPGVLAGRNGFRWPEPGELLAVNYDILPEQPAAPPCPGTVVIADEAHALKTGKSNRTKRFRKLAGEARRRGGKTWLLTGTPMPNKPPELWHVLYSAGLAQDAFGSWPNFQRLFHGRKNHWGGVEYGAPRPEVPQLLRRVMLRREREEVLPELPTKLYRTIPVRGISRATRQILDEGWTQLQLYQGRYGDDHLQGAISFEEISRARAELAAAKIPSLLELVEAYEEASEPLVVFSAHRLPIDTLGQRDGWATITGDVAADERTRIVEQFQAGRLKGLALTIAAGGTGLTLTHAHQVLFIDLDWTPALNAQAEDRVCRIGQTRGVVVTRLVADHPLDQRVTELLSAKQELITAAVERAAVPSTGS